MSDLLLRRRQMMAGGSPTPPSYQRIEYLESSGTQWIRTDFAPAQDDIRVYVDFSRNNVGGDNMLFGMAQYAGNDFAVNAYGGLYLYYWIGGANGTVGNDWTQRHTIDISDKVYVDNVLINTLTLTKTFVGNTNKLCLFALPTNPQATAAAYIFKGKIYELIAYYGVVEQMHLLPVRVGTVGYMYDTVSQQLYGNVGTGDFILGPDI